MPCLIGQSGSYLHLLMSPTTYPLPPTRSLLATNDALFEPMMARFEGPMEKLHAAGVKLGPANVPKGYKVKSGAQLE
jgi:hypothetical protein